MEQVMEQAIQDATAVKMVREYLDECEAEGKAPDIGWMRFLLDGCPLEPWQMEILSELDCPEVPRIYKGKSPCAATQEDE